MSFLLFLAIAVLSVAISASSCSEETFQHTFPQFVTVRSSVQPEWTPKTPLDIVKGETEIIVDEEKTSILQLGVLLHSDADWKELIDLKNKGLIWGVSCAEPPDFLKESIDEDRLAAEDRKLLDRHTSSTSNRGSMLFRENGDQQVLQLGRRQLSGLSTKAHMQHFENFKCYRTVNDTMASIDKMVRDFPDLASKHVIGKSYLKAHDLTVVILTNSKSTVSSKIPIYMVAGLHPRELAPPEAVTRFAEQLLYGFGHEAEATWLLDHFTFHIQPHGNPDTRVLTEKDLTSLLRKNQRDVGCPSGKGVDLNRNFPMYWGQANASTDRACDSSYRGKSAESEPESKAVMDYAKAIFDFPQVKTLDGNEARNLRGKPCPDTAKGFFFDVHSFGEYVTYPWSNSGNHYAPNKDAMISIASKLAWHGNYKLWGPGSPDFAYAVSGGSDDSVYGMLCVPAYTLEIGTAFSQQCDEFDQRVLPVVTPMLRYGAKLAHQPYTATRGPDVRKLTFDNTSGLLTVTVSETEMLDFTSRKIPAPPTETIAAVRVYIDEHPSFVNSATAIDLTAKDGTFDSKTETATVMLFSGKTIVDFEVLDGNARPVFKAKPQTPYAPAVGTTRHMVFVQAEDSAGFKGPVQAFYAVVK